MEPHSRPPLAVSGLLTDLLLGVSVITRPACRVITIIQTHVHAGVPLPSRLFLTRLETATVYSGG